MSGPETLNVALVQMTSGPDIDANLKTAGDMIRVAALDGAQFIQTPENTCHMRFPATEKLKTAKAEGDHPALPYFSDLARDLGVWIHVGSIAVKVAEDKMANRGYIFAANGDIAARYDKIHLFDVDLPTGETHRESAHIVPGDKAVVVDTPFGKIGMGICYDLRFAPLFRALAQGGARILTVPAAFTVPTGLAHWESLLRARAIETGSFVLAAAQCGTHEGGRMTYGHSLVVDPWGKVLAEGGDAPGLITATLNLADSEKARSAIPALRHDRNFNVVSV